MIGFYVHHHGHGHMARTRAIVEALGEPCVILSEAEPGDWLDAASGRFVRLSSDRPMHDDLGDVTARGRFHWLPDAPHLLTRRCLTMVEAFEKDDIDTLVVDVSVEAAVLARLCGLRVITVASHGDRSDAAHQLGRSVSSVIIAPYPRALGDDSDEETPVVHVGFVVADDARPSTPAPNDERPILVVSGSGGSRLCLEALDELAAVADAPVDVVGPFRRRRPSGSLRVLGWVDDLPWRLASAGVVIGHGGANVVAEVARAGARFCCVSEPRPFGEQADRAIRLDRLGIAVVRHHWPRGDEWRTVIDETRALDPAGLAALWAEGGAGRAAEVIRSVRGGEP